MFHNGSETPKKRVRDGLQKKKFASTLLCMIDSLKFKDLSHVNLSKLLFPEFNRVSNIIKSIECLSINN